MRSLKRPPLLWVYFTVALWMFIPGSATAAGPKPPPSAAPIQAWVFDGAYHPSVTFAVSFTDSGLLTQVTSSLDCQDERPSRIGFFSLSPEQVGVFPVRGTLQVGPAIDPSFFPQAPVAPIDPELVENNCDALANEAAVQSYVSILTAEVSSLAAQVGQCVEDVHETACRVLAAAEAAAAICDADPDRCTTVALPSEPLPPMCDKLSSSSGSLPPSCVACRIVLQVLPFRVSEAESALAGCQYALSPLQVHLERLQAFLSGEFFSHPGGFFPDEVLWQIDCAEKARQRMEETASAVSALTPSCSHESLVENCDLCPDDEAPVLELSGAVTLRQSARHLGRLVGRFRSASAQTSRSDPALAAKYADLASRLSAIPDLRVLEVEAPADSALTQQFVALRRPDVPDDLNSPLAVVITMVRGQANQSPTFNALDRALLDKAFETFKTTLAPDRRCSTCPPPR